MRARLLLAALATLVPAAAGLSPTGAADAGKCQRWNVEVSCSVSRPAVVIGEDFTATVVAKNTGDSALSNVTLRVRADQGAPCAAGAGASTSILVDKFEAGESKTLTARFVTEGIGTARILGSARDSLGWASGNCACTVDVYGLPAVQTDMADKDITGAEKGIFKVGEEFLYVLTVENDQGSSATPELKVVISLPKELEFVSGTSDAKVTVTGSGQAAETSGFALVPPNQKVTISLRVRALAAPPSQLVKVKAVVQTAGGIALATEVESTTIQN
jgi:hypothetical protein